MIKKLNVILFFMGLLIMGILNLIFFNRGEISVAENRTLAKFPEFSSEKLKNGEFFTGIENYYSDHFMFRDSWIGLSNKISAFKGKTGEEEAEIITINTGDQFAPDPNEATKEANKKESKEDNKKEISTSNENPNQSENRTDGKELETEKKSELVNSVADVNDRVKLYAKKSISEYLVKNPEAAKDVQDAENISQALPNGPNTEMTVPDADSGDDGEMRSNFLVLKDAAYEIFGYREASCQLYAQAINDFASKMPEKTRVFSLVAPSHSEFITNKKYREMGESQEEAINLINSFFNSRIIPVDARSNLIPHYQEYLYFRSDHHWTARGAYYAYEAFVKKAGFSPVTLDKYERKEFPGFLGTLYDKTRSAKVAANPDTVEAFIPIVESDFKIHTRQGNVLDWNVINENYGKPDFKNKYLVFMSGDEPLSIITTNVDTDRKILVFKDSYGNAFIPFLMNHYKEIHVIDPRHFKSNAVAYANENNIDDVLFINYAVVIAGNQNFTKNIQRVTQ